MDKNKIIIESKIKSFVKESQVASDVAEELNKKVVEMLERAEERAKLNGRRTVFARDL
jgi:histone H3/H4